jgi:hypothetical protein
VKASIGRIVAEAAALREIGVGTIAIMPNDTGTYAEDSFDNMKAFAALWYLIQGALMVLGGVLGPAWHGISRSLSHRSDRF